MRDTRITLWPEQTGYLPLLSPWADIKNKRTLDISACLRVDSCGLAGSILKLHHIFLHNSAEPSANRSQFSLPISSCDPDRIHTLHSNQDSELTEHCHKLNFFQHVRPYLDEELQKKYKDKEYKDPILTEKGGVKKMSFPVFRINFSENSQNRRAPLEALIYRLERYFNSIPNDFHFHKTQLITTLIEIAKNSADHTEHDAYLGCDFIFSSKTSRLALIIGDLGLGIYTHLKPHIEKILPQRKSKLGLAEVYKWALEDGNSSRIDSGKNMGLGMSFIIENCRALGAHLSVFDVKSRGLLSSLPTTLESNDPAAHNVVWRCFQRVDGIKPFFYYIELEVQNG